jgi:hypothetical protein
VRCNNGNQVRGLQNKKFKELIDMLRLPNYEIKDAAEVKFIQMKEKENRDIHFAALLGKGDSNKRPKQHIRLIDHLRLVHCVLKDDAQYAPVAMKVLHAQSQKTLP